MSIQQKERTEYEKELYRELKKIRIKKNQVKRQLKMSINAIKKNKSKLQLIEIKRQEICYKIGKKYCPTQRRKKQLTKEIIDKYHRE